MIDLEEEEEEEEERECDMAHLRKITKTPDAFEELVAKAFVDLETSNSELKADIKELYITSAKEIDIGGGRKSIIIHVPFRLLKAFNKIQQRLVRELEKKFSGKDVVIVASRRMLNKTKSLKVRRTRYTDANALSSPSLRARSLAVCVCVCHELPRGRRHHSFSSTRRGVCLCMHTHIHTHMHTHTLKERERERQTGEISVYAKMRTQTETQWMRD